MNDYLQGRIEAPQFHGYSYYRVYTCHKTIESEDIRMMWWHELTMSAGQKKNMKLHLNLNRLSNAGNGGKAGAKNFLRKSIDKGNSSSCGPCLITTTRGYAKHHRTSWTRPNWKLYICACSGRSEEKTWQRNKSAAAGAFQKITRISPFSPCFPFWRCLEMSWKQKPSESNQMLPTCTFPTIKFCYWVGDTGDTPQPSLL